MNIAICDDERVIREQISELIEKENPGLNLSIYGTGDELLAAKKPFDMVFLDIQMEGTNGMETARLLREQNEDIILIFVTGIKEYVFEAFDVAAFQYLLKPIDEGRFREVFLQAKKELGKRQKRRQEPIFIKTRKRSFTLNKEEILFIESRAKKVGVHTVRETIEVYASMNELEAKLGVGFYRCHRGYLVNLAYVAEYNSEGITLQNGEQVYLAKEKYGAFVKTYMRYLRNGVGADE